MVAQETILKEYQELKQKNNLGLHALSLAIANKYQLRQSDVYIVILGLTTNLLSNTICY